MQVSEKTKESHWEQIYGTKYADAVSWYTPHLTRSLELIAEAALALEMGATLTDLALTIHPHPTLSESLMEAAEAFHKQAIHILNR